MDRQRKVIALPAGRVFVPGRIPQGVSVVGAGTHLTRVAVVPDTRTCSLAGK